MDQPTSEIILSAHDVAKRFDTQAGTLELFRGIDLTVRQGESIAIIGPSGAGKSTLLSLLAGLDLASSGHIEIAGTRLDRLTEQARAQLRAHQISFVFQTFHLLPELSALENVLLPLEIRAVADAKAQAKHWLRTVGLEARLNHYPAQLSGGEQQRVAIARAFATRPALLFADEPTGNLDEHTGTAIIDQLFSLNSEQGTTLVLITHDIQLASRCQRCLRLHHGILEQVSL